MRSGYDCVFDDRLEFDDWMSLIVLVGRVSLASCAKVCIIADSALEAHPFNVGLIGFARAQGSVTIDANMTRLVVSRRFERLVDRYESMHAMRHLAVASIAQIEIGTVETLVADSKDRLSPS